MTPEVGALISSFVTDVTAAAAAGADAVDDVDDDDPVVLISSSRSRCISSRMSLRVCPSTFASSRLPRASQCELKTTNEERAAARTSPTASVRPLLMVDSS